MAPDLPHIRQRTLRLDNGLRVALVHDRQATRAALAIGVGAGSFHEPPAYPGLAHFLEHGVFLGSANFPAVGALASYVLGVGGRYNARTLSLQTLYFMETPAGELAAAAGHLLDLVAFPLLAGDALQAETEILHAEYLARCRDNDCQLLGAIAGLLNPQHPMAHFHAGSRETLNPQDPALFATLRDWHARHYRAANLHLLLTGPQSLDELEQCIRLPASRLPGGPCPASASWPPLWPAGQPPVELLLEQPQTAQHMSLWLMPVPLAPAEQPLLLEWLRQSLAKPAAGGLLGELQARRWAQRIDVEWQATDGGHGLLVLRIELLDQGHGQERAIAALCVDWLQHLAADPALGVAPDELQVLRRESAWQEFELPPMERAALWVERWQREDVLDWHPWPGMQATPLPGGCALALQSAQPMVVQGSRPHLPHAEQTPWFPVRMQAQPLVAQPALAMPRWQSPPRNPLVARLLDGSTARPAADRAPAPDFLRPGHAALLLAWQMPGNLDPAVCAAAELADAALMGLWQQALCAAACLGYDWQSLSRPGQLRFCLSGPDAALQAVLESLLDALQRIDPAQVRAALQRQRLLSGQQMLLRQLLAHPAANGRLPPEMNWPAGQPDQWDDAELVGRVDAFLADAVLYGRWFAPAPPGLLNALGRPLAGLPPPVQPAAYGGEHARHLGLDDREQAVLLRLLAPPTTPEWEAAWRVLAVLYQNPFYQSLRVEQGLGYALFSRFHAGEEGAELQFGVQSPHADGPQLQQAIRRFLEREGEALARLSPERLGQARRAAQEALAGGNRRVRLLRACTGWLGGQEAQHQAAVAEALQRLDAQRLQRAAADLGRAEWRWLLS